MKDEDEQKGMIEKDIITALVLVDHSELHPPPLFTFVLDSRQSSLLSSSCALNFNQLKIIASYERRDHHLIWAHHLLMKRKSAVGSS